MQTWQFLKTVKLKQNVKICVGIEKERKKIKIECPKG